MKHNLKQIVTGNIAVLSYVCAGVIYYNIDVEDVTYQLGIDSTDEEWKTTYLYPTFKAITLMRWIRKAIENGSLIQIK